MASLVAGLAVARLDGAPQALGVVLAAGAMIGLVGLGAGGRVPALPQPVRVPGPPLGRASRMVLSDARFRPFLRYSLLWGLAVNLSSPFFMQHAVEVLGFSVAGTAALVAVHLGAGALVLPFWGRVADRYGNRVLLVGCGVCGALVPFLWLAFARPELPGAVFLVEFVSGAAWAGINLATAAILVKLAPADQRVGYVAIVSAITGLGLAGAPVLGGVLLSWLLSVSPTWGFAWMMLLAGTIRLAALCSIRSVPEPGARSLRHSTRVLFRVGPRWITPSGLGTAMLWLPTVAESAGSLARREAKRSVRRLQSSGRSVAVRRRRVA